MFYYFRLYLMFMLYRNELFFFSCCSVWLMFLLIDVLRYLCLCKYLRYVEDCGMERDGVEMVKL